MAFKEKVKYMFNIPLIESLGKGNFATNWTLEGLSSHVLLESFTKGESDITVMRDWNFGGDLENEANYFLDARRLRSAVRTVFNSNINKQEKQKRSSNNNILQFDLSNSLALEVSLRRIIATVDYTSTNNVDLASFITNGRHIVKGELDCVPLSSFKTVLNIDAIQPSILGDAELIQSINLAIISEKQMFTWSGKEQLASLIHAFDFVMANDESEVRMELAESVEGHLAFLKSVKLPVYQKTIWDVLKFDLVTNIDNLQFLNISCGIAYSKTMDGQEYAIPSQIFENGVTFSIPEINIAVPSWVKEIPHSIRNIDMRFENANVPDHLTLPPAISIPAFDIPFTNLHVDSFTIDPKNLNIPKVITTKAFEVMLPGFPIISVPSYDINTEYLRGKMSFMSFKMPQYDVTISSFTLPKSFAIGEHTISLNEITRQISNFEFPSIVIPEQRIEIPEIALHLPSSVFIPGFGALSGTLKLSSPIYNISTNTNLEKKDSSLVTSLTSFCTSTMMFLEYNLFATVTLGFDNGAIQLNGKCSLVHSDVNVDSQYDLVKNLRIKRQAPMADSMESHYLNVDITSQSFTDVSFRFASRKDGFTTSVSSPSVGFLGWHFQQRTPSQLYGKLFSRHVSSPGIDNDAFVAKAMLRNSQKLIIQMGWNWDFIHDVIEGTKNRVPAMTSAVVEVINKYHIAHFGFDLNRGSMKLKNTVSNTIEKAYHEVPMAFNTLQSSVKHIADQGKDMYSKASDTLMSLSMQDIIDWLTHMADQVLKHSENLILRFENAGRWFLLSIKFTPPGSEETLSGLEMFQQARQSVLRAADKALQRFTKLMEDISRLIRGTEFTIPGTDVVFNGNEIMDKLGYSRGFVDHHLKLSLNRWHMTLNEQGDRFLSYLKDENVEIASQIDDVYAEVLQSTRLYIEEAKSNVADLKDLTKLKIQEAYSGLNMESVNNSTIEVINILQSHLYGGLNEGVDLIKRASQSTAPYIKVTTKKADIEIPLPFIWKSFSSWPVESRQ